MATAQQAGGFYRTAQGVAVDANGDEIKGAPKPTPDTDPSKQPGGVAAATSEERIGLAIADALSGKTAARLALAASAKAPAKTDSDTSGEDESLPTIKDLPDAVAKLKTVAEVKAMAKRDDRATAEKIYDARIAEIEGE